MSAALFASLRPGQKHRLGALGPGADARLLAAQIEPGLPLLVLTADAQAAQRLKEEIPVFAPAARVLLLPDWETLPYDHFSPHADLVSERLATLWQIRQGQADIILAPVSTAMTRLAPVSFLAGRTFMLSQGQKLNADALRADLALAG